MKLRLEMPFLMTGSLSAHQCGADVESTHQQPSIVRTLADDMGDSDLDCYASEIPPPNIDKLTAAGLRFAALYDWAATHQVYPKGRTIYSINKRKHHEKESN